MTLGFASGCSRQKSTRGFESSPARFRAASARATSSVSARTAALSSVKADRNSSSVTVWAPAADAKTNANRPMRNGSRMLSPRHDTNGDERTAAGGALRSGEGFDQILRMEADSRGGGGS